jgi:tetratricopeptide (TPR) repeat protein
LPAATLALAVVSFLSAAPAPSDKENIARWVMQLGDDDFARREEASAKLWAAGEAAEAALRAVADSSDAEVSRRARDILERFKWGIYPETPKKVVDLISRYQSGDRGSSGSIIKELFENGPAGCKAVLKIARAEEDAGIRRRLYSQISNEMARSVPRLLAEDNFDTLELMVDTVLDHDLNAGMSNYVAFWLLRGKVRERIAQLESRTAKEPGDRKAWEILAYLHRANDDPARARAAAEKSGRADLLDGLLLEAGAWKELAARPVGTETTHEAERLGLRAVYHRLSGDSKGFEEAVAALRKLGSEGKDDEGTAYLVAKALFLNDRPNDALEFLARSADRSTAFEVLVARMQIRDALKLVDKEREAGGKQAAEPDKKEAGGKQLAELEILAARTLWTLGEKDKALPVFARYSERIVPGSDASWFETLVESEVRTGQTDRALADSARVLSLPMQQGWEHRLLPKLFPSRGDAAEAWWTYLRQREPDRDAAKVVKEISDILRGKAPASRVKELVTGAAEPPRSNENTNEAVEQRALALAAAARAVGADDLARSTLEKAATPATLQKLGDLLAEKKEWDSAADYYRRAWEVNRQKPLPLFLWGHALAKAGKKAEGERRMEQSHWLPLGNEEARHEFLVALGERDLIDASKRENELLERVSQPASYYAGEAQRRKALYFQSQRDYLRAADCEERAMLRCLRTYVSFVQAPAYVAVPAKVHRERARGLMAAGRIDEALREANRCLEELPGEVDVPILLSPGLEKAGRKKEATVLFARVNGVLLDVCKDYPKCSWAHNSVAWLSACCGRDLDQGLTHAQRAVELEPNVAGYRDTLAEVYFQRGDKAKAAEAQKKAIELDPKKPYYAKQLKRIEAGNPAAQRPPEDDDEE